MYKTNLKHLEKGDYISVKISDNWFIGIVESIINNKTAGVLKITKTNSEVFFIDDKIFIHDDDVMYYLDDESDVAAMVI